MKKIVSVILVTLMLASLMVPALAEESVTLTMWIWDENQKKGTQAMIDAYTAAHPNVAIELACQADYFTKLPTVIGTKDCPDIMWLWGTGTVDYIESGMLHDLQEFIDRDQYDTTQWVESIQQWYTRNDHLFAIPKDFDGYCVFYNKAMFDAKGIAYPSDDWTWEDFASTAKALSGDEQYGYTGVSDHRIVSAASLSFGGGYFSDDGLICTINNEQNAKAWDFLKELQNDGASASYTDLVELGTNTMFTSGIAAMAIEGSWNIKNFYDGLGDDLACVQVPTGDAGKVITTHGIGYAMSATCEYPEEAWGFLAYLGTEEAQLLLSDVVIPANLKASEQWSSYYEMDVSPVIAALDYAVMYPMASKNSSETNSIESKYINGFFAGEYANAAECLAAAQAEMQTTIDK